MAKRNADSIDPQDAIRWWHDRCLGTPRLIGDPLAYEPRAAWGCSRCHAVVVGVKSGELYRIADSGIEPLHTFSNTSVQAVHGCPGHLAGGGPAAAGKVSRRGSARRRPYDETPAVVGDGAGGIHVVGPGGVAPAPSLGGGKAMAVRLIHSPKGKPWCLAATDDQHLVLVPLDGSDRVREEVPRNVRWMLRQGGIPGAEAPDNYRWLLVTMEGHLARARLSWENDRPAIKRFSVGRLREAPTCVAADRRFGRLRAVLYGFEKGLRVATLDAHGVRAERILMDGHRIHYCRVAEIFRTPHVIACGEGGRVSSRIWDNPEDTHEVPWLPWPAMPSDALFVEIGAPDPPWQVDATLVLRNHRVYGVPLYNIRHVRQGLMKIRRHWQARDDAECFAEVTASADEVGVARLLVLADHGGERTLNGIVERLTRHPTPAPREAVQVSVAVLIAAMRLGCDAVRRLAPRLHSQLLALVRDIPSHPEDGGEAQACRDLERWAIFLKKHYLMARTFSEKREDLRRYVHYNTKRSTPDALTYEARLRYQGFDVPWEYEEPLRSPVLAVHAQPSRNGQAEFVALSLADGSLARVVLQAGSRPSFQWEHPPPVAPARVFGNYSRIMHVTWTATGETWLVAPRAAPRPPALPLPALVRMPRLSRDTEPDPDAHHQVHALCRIDDNTVLLGLRDPKTPLARWNLTTDDVTEIKMAATALHVRSAVQGGERRVWTILGLGRLDGKQALAIGAEDGFLRVGVCREREFEAVDVEFLGSSVRAATLWEGDGRRLLVAGTERSEIFCFEVVEDAFPPKLSLKFRDVLLYPVARLFATELAPGRPCACVLDREGRLTAYDLLRSRPAFLGRRTDPYTVAAGATTAVPVGEGRMLVCGWDDRRQQGQLRLLDFQGVGAARRTGERPHHLDSALTEAQDFAEGRALDLLASFPLADGSLRAALVAARLGEKWDTKALRPLRREALAAYPGDRAEIKALLDAAVARLRSPDHAGAVESLRCLYDVFIRRGPDGLDEAGATETHGADERSTIDDRPENRDPRLRAAIIRRLLVAPTLRLWREAGFGPEHLVRWIGRHLQDPERVVRVETLRALSEALLELVRQKADGEEGELAFRTAFPGEPPVASAGWLLGVLTAFLLAHPATVHGSECDASTWAAVSVLVNLLRLMPESAFVILDHISVAGVDPAVFGILKGRLNSHQDQEQKLVAKLKRYIPWVDHDPNAAELEEHCRPFQTEAGQESLRESLGVEPGQPDHDYWQAYVRGYSVLGKMVEPIDRDDLEALATELKLDLPSAPAWAKTLLSGRERFLQVTGEWIHSRAVPLLVCLKVGSSDRAQRQADALKSIQAERRRLAGEGGPPGVGGPPIYLAAPTLGIARAILAHWNNILFPPLPGEGQALGPYRLGNPLPDHERVFDLEGTDLIVHIAATDSRKETEALIETWNAAAVVQARRGAESRIVPIVAVVDRAPRPGLVMKKLPATDLRRSEAVLAALPTPMRYELAFNCTVDIAGALADVHSSKLYHGDVRPSNILWLPAGDRRRFFEDSFYLVDFGRAGNKSRIGCLRSGTNRAVPLVYPGLIENLRLVLQDFSSVAKMQAGDAAGLYQTVVSLICADPEEGLDAHPAQSIRATLPTDGCPDHLREWLSTVARRWKALQQQPPVWSPLLPEDLLDDALGKGNHLYVASVSGGDTEAIREKLYSQSFPGWVVQGHQPTSVGPILPQLQAMMKRCRYVVVLLGEHPGRTPPADEIPAYALEGARALQGWPQGDLPTYTQCELFMARRLRKRLLPFSVGNPPEEPRQKAVWRDLAARTRVRPVTLDDCVEVVTQALRDEQAAEAYAADGR